MSRILFQINYDVYPDKRDEYIETVKELERYMLSNTKHNYMVMEDKNRRNNFTEVYILRDEAEFEGLEDEMDDTIYGLTTKILSQFVVEGKTRYSTFYEI
ncbi:MAG: hypothetical protein N2510_02780 [Ignavibacteria bacterium]|nr:hypothetical protein [Ignavibacteria bacterium]